MNWWTQLQSRFCRKPTPEHLKRGQLGEAAARNHLQEQGLVFLAANFRSGKGEIDLVMRDGAALVFVEVKTRTAGGWTRPAAAVNARKRRLLSRTALAYLKLLHHPAVPLRFDIVEVLLDRNGALEEIRHLPNTFSLEPPCRYG